MKNLSSFDRIVCDNISRLFKEKNKKQRDLAQLLGITEASVSRYCKGVNVPDTCTLVKISEFFDVTIYEILGIKDENQYTSKDKEIIKAYKASSDEIKEAIDKILNIKK